MGIVEQLRSTLARVTGNERADPGLPFGDWLGYFGQFNYGGATYPFMTGGQTLGAKQEVPRQNFQSYIQTIYKQNGVVFACMAARMLLFSEARFQFRRRIGGRPEELFGNPSLDILEHPWTNATTGDLLTRAIQDADLAGNFYAVRRMNKILRMRPDWVTIVIGSKSEPDDPGWAMDAEVVGYIYQPYGPGVKRAPETLLPDEVAHFAPYPDPAFRFRGMSWLQPVIGEIMGDGAATTHKLKFFEAGATPNLVVTLDPKVAMDEKKFTAFTDKMREQHEGALNAYRTLYLANGSTATPVGSNMRQIDFKVTQGAGETRIAAAAGVPPVIVGLSEGLAASTYSNYAQARRRFTDGTMRPLWRNMAGSLEHLVTLPAGAELWYDDRDIPFLQEDRKDQADIFHINSQAAESLVRAGFEPDSIVKAIDSGDMTRLKHTGLFSVQMQTPGSLKMPEQPPIVPGEPVFKEIPATSNKPGETGAPKAIAAPATKPAAGRDETRPLGPYPDFAACVADQKSKGHDEESARKICGKIEVQTKKASLTPRETEIARMMAMKTNKEIADLLVISERTVETHAANVMAKLGIHSRIEVTAV